MKDPFRIAHDNVFRTYPRGLEHPGAGNTCRPGAVDNHLHLPDRLSRELGGIHEAGGADNSRSMLVVVKNGYAAFLDEPLFYLETFGCLDILQVDPPEGGLENLDDFNNFFRVPGIELQVEHIDIGKPLEEDTLSLHNRFRSQGPPVSEAENGRTVGNDGYKVSPGGIGVGIFGMLGYLKNGFGHPGSIGQ